MLCYSPFFLHFFTHWKLEFGKFQSHIGRLCAVFVVVVVVEK